MHDDWKGPEKWGFRKLTVGKFDRRQVSGIKPYIAREVWPLRIGA